CGEQGLRIASHEDIGFEFANDAHNLTAHMQVGNKITIRSIHKMDCLHTNNFCGCILFLMADGAESIGSHFCGRRLVKAFVTAGEELISDMMARACPKSQSSPAEKLRV